MTEPRSLVIAIDGPAGSGKSTLARRLADALGIPYVNTGLMYRAVTRAVLDRGIDPEDEEALAEVAMSLRFEVDPVSGSAQGRLLVDGRAAGEELRTHEVDEMVSAVSRHQGVRSILRDAQRRLAADGGVVEGRDIGRVVFPDAEIKLFLDASPDERAARRTRERGVADEGGPERIEAALDRRDALDARLNPFVPSDDAVVIDTTDLDADAVLARALEIVRRHESRAGTAPSA